MGFGTSYIAEAEEKDAVAVIRRAYESGVNYYDLSTAEGRTFPYFGTAPGNVRKNVFYQIHFGTEYSSGTYGFIHCIDEVAGWKQYRKADARMQCGHCEARCPFHVRQEERMKEIAVYFGRDGVSDD